MTKKEKEIIQSIIIDATNELMEKGFSQHKINKMRWFKNLWKLYKFKKEA
jgi:hypothetical protein